MTEVERERYAPIKRERAARDRARKERARHERLARFGVAAAILLAFLAGYIGAALRAGAARDNRETERSSAGAAAKRMVAVLPPEIKTETALAPDKLLESVPLDAETQNAIFAVAGKDETFFCLLMAIAEHESGFDSAAVGDGGKSRGMFQINTRWHTGRMERLGVTDLADPVQCARVAADYLLELSDTYEADLASHAILMMYNAGAAGARRMLNRGIAATAYSRAVADQAGLYRAELRGSE